METNTIILKVNQKTKPEDQIFSIIHILELLQGNPNVKIDIQIITITNTYYDHCTLKEGWAETLRSHHHLVATPKNRPWAKVILLSWIKRIRISYHL